MATSTDHYYLKVAQASDLVEKNDRALYRFFEVLPGACAWVTLIAIGLGSWKFPVATSIFIIAFDVYWLIKTVFLSLHLRASYARMKKHMAIDWTAELDGMGLEKYRVPVKNWKDIRHLVLLPFYSEPVEVLRETLKALAGSRYPHEKLIVILGAEARAGEDATRAASILEKEFSQQFFAFLVTVHPSDIPGELSGKGANETWMARVAKEKIIDPLSIPYSSVIVSSIDADTQMLPDYFTCVTYHYLTADKPLRSSYQPIPIYNNNIWQAPAFSRVVATSGTFWQMMQQARPERLSTFSSHSMPLASLVDQDFWHTNIVSEDSRIFWQSLLFYDGDYRVIPLYYPVLMDAHVVPGFLQTAKGVYKQQRRWGWGVENVPYILFGFIRNKKIPIATKAYFTFNALEGFWSWATNSFILFFLGWLPTLLGGKEFNSTVLAYNLPFVTRTLMTLAMTGLVTSAIISTSLLPPRPAGQPFRRYLWMTLQWLLVPFTIVAFGAIPGLEAQTRLMLGKYMSFWVTPKWRSPKAG